MDVNKYNVAQNLYWGRKRWISRTILFHNCSREEEWWLWPVSSSGGHSGRTQTDLEKNSRDLLHAPALRPHNSIQWFPKWGVSPSYGARSYSRRGRSKVNLFQLWFLLYLPFTQKCVHICFGTCKLCAQSVSDSSSRCVVNQNSVMCPTSFYSCQFSHPSSHPPPPTLSPPSLLHK